MIHFDVDFTPISANAVSDVTTKAEKILAVQVLEDTDQYVPANTTMFATRARVEENEVIYSGVQARYLWNGKAMVDSKTGKGPMNIPDVGYRFHEGATLVATEKDLVFNKMVHPKATDHWFLASKKDNLAKWVRVTQKAVANGF